MAARYAPTRGTKVPEIRKGDTVVVLTGKDAGKRGTVERVINPPASPSATRSIVPARVRAGGIKVVVEGINMAKRHTKPRQSARPHGPQPKVQQGGIFDLAQPLRSAR